VRRGVAVAIVIAALALATAFWIGRAGRRPVPSAVPVAAPRSGGDPAALARLRTVPLFRALVESGAVRSGTLEGDRTVHVEIDLRQATGSRLSALGLAGVSALLPATATGTIVIATAAGSDAGVVSREAWVFPGPAPLLELLDRAPRGTPATRAEDAVPGTPAAVVRARLRASRLADPAFGGAALASLRDRMDVVERLLGRPIRAEVAEDLAGPAVFALYETAGSTEADALATFELRRADRLSGLLDTLFALGALTERASVGRYRGVATGSFVPAAGGAGLALAVDGSVLFVATSRARLESGIDALRTPGPRDGVPSVEGAGSASWSAISRSGFVARGWSRLARSAGGREADAPAMAATLRPDGATGWRLEGNGPAPAITADPLVPFLRGVLVKFQRDGG